MSRSQALATDLWPVAASQFSTPSSAACSAPRVGVNFTYLTLANTVWHFLIQSSVSKSFAQNIKVNLWNWQLSWSSWLNTLTGYGLHKQDPTADRFYFIIFCTALHPYSLGASRKLRRLCFVKSCAGETDVTVSCRLNMWLLMFNVTRVTNLHTQYLTPICCTMFSFVDYCADMIRLRLLVIYRELSSFSTCEPYTYKLMWYIFYRYD